MNKYVCSVRAKDSKGRKTKFEMGVYALNKAHARMIVEEQCGGNFSDFHILPRKV